MHIYFDNASTTPMHPEVLSNMYDVLAQDFGNPSSIHWHGRKAKSLIEQSRKSVAKALNASIGEIFFTSCATEATNMILKMAVEDLGVRRIISSPTEHHCVLHTLDYLKSKNLCDIVYLQVDQEGHIQEEALINLLENDDTKTLVSLMHGNNEIGTMHDITRIGQICHEHGALYHCDAVQTIGKYAIDVQKSNINFLTGSGHKFHGPKGIGFVFISNDNIISPYILGGAQERNMRAGTENIAGITGIAKALELATSDMDKNHQYVTSLRERFKSLLNQHIHDVRYNGDQNNSFMAHVLNVSFPPSLHADLLVMNLDIEGISTSSGSACSSGIEEDSHVLQAIGHPTERKAIRFSFSPNNTLEEVAYTIEVLKRLLA
ncbi:MAG: cysteine desulfurase [Chitinophagales bacterium]|nr:cysteine desulfurase [Chitinophagales bacterium]